MQQIVKKTVLITGSNKGLGYGLVEDLFSKHAQKYRIIMTSRDEQRGKDSFEKIKSQFPNEEVDFHLLDIEQSISRENLKKYVEDKYGKIDVLVNNAAYLLHHDLFDQPEDYQPNQETAKQTLSINLFGTIAMTELLNPIIANDGKILQIGSRAGLISRQPLSTQEKLNKSEGFTKQTIIELAEDFQKQCENKVTNEENKRWSFSAYEVSKCLLNAYIRHICPSLIVGTSKSIYSITPGWVKTDMGTQKATRTIEEGNDTSLYLITQVPFGDQSQFNCAFVADRNVIDW